MKNRDLSWENNDPNEESISTRQNHLLVIGINEYLHHNPLNNCVLDAKTFIEVLTRKYQFDPTNITTLFDHQATREAVLNAFHKLSRKLTDQDNLIIYFAGHGYYEKEEKSGFLVPVDGNSDSLPSLIYNTQIRGLIQGMKVHHLFLVVDSCFSGDLILRSTEKPEAGAIYASRIDAFPSR